MVTCHVTPGCHLTLGYQGDAGRPLGKQHIYVVAYHGTDLCFAGEAVQRQLAEGGVLWFSDLTLPDSTWILPISLGILNLLTVELFALRKIELSRFQKIVTNFIRAISVLMIPIAASVPSVSSLDLAHSRMFDMFLSVYILLY
ncbi:hypothetical protein FKM82_026955 [Ascaphus truei]